MTDQQALLAGVIQYPDEDTPRCMYADWLMESGNSLDNKLGEYIKLSLELHHHKNKAKPRVDNTLKEIQYSNDYQWDFHAYEWYERGIELNRGMNESWLIAREHISYKYYLDRKPTHFIPFEVNRGFISSTTCTASQFLSVCDKLIWHPSMVEECPNPNAWFLSGKHVVGDNGKKHSAASRAVTCHMCNGYRVIPRPCPLTAHPIREVHIVEPNYSSIAGSPIRVWQMEKAQDYDIKFTINGNED